MRYLNKIIFINSADKSIRYAEINLDGNVHFIGTQGVGKSTLLRAILFFYNADKTKLGIPREKKTFDEYYLPYQNSYLIYEVKADHGSFCVLAFKSQGRTAFRFFDSQYDQQLFIDHEGKAFETWDKIREALGRNISYTKIIHSYEEYRNILYGNNKGLSPEFRKYAILESKQYQNIPRTITNVFLNTNLSAEFVKQTIIKSLNEEEITIDLATYSQNHLRDFESNLNDIKKWTDKNRNGENAIEKQAEKVSTFYSAIRHLEKRKNELAGHLGAALQNVEDQLPNGIAALQAEELKSDKVKAKLRELDNVFEKKKEKIQEQIGKYKSKLDETKKAREKYAALKIDVVLSRVAKKNVLEFEKKNLSDEKAVLSNHFFEIQQRYDALLKQLVNQQHEFENTKKAEKNHANENFLQWRENLGSQYELLYEEVRNQHRQELEVASGIVKEKEYALTNQKIRRSDARNKQYYEKEIENCRNDISGYESAIVKSAIATQQAKEKISNIQEKWQLEETAVTEDLKRKVEKQNDVLSILNQRMVSVANKIKHNKNSLYAWLNEHLPGWENTIGKVIDEEHVLFQQDLNPRKITGTDFNFYGISIDTDEIDKKVKTVADYEQEKQELDNQVQSARKTLSDLDANKIEELEKLKRRFQPKIKEQKEISQNNEYEGGQSQLKLDEAGVQLAELRDKAEKEKNEILKDIEGQIETLNEELITANEQLQKIGGSINKQIETKKKEKENKLKKQQQKLQEDLALIDGEIDKERKVNTEKSEIVKSNQKDELDQKGADTKRLTAIELRLTEIQSELIFIENNRDIVAEFNKDKRELFDREEDFKNNKSLLEKELGTEQSKHEQQKTKLLLAIKEHDEQIASIKNTVASFESDLKAFEVFKKSEIFEPIEDEIIHFPVGAKIENRVSEIIDELNRNHYQGKDRFADLQEAINKFTGNFQENNIFSFKTKFISREEYLEFAELLKEFIEEDKISEYKKRVEDRFAHIIRQIGKETGELISKEGEIHGVISEINKDFVARNFVGAVKSMELRTVTSANRIFQLLVEIKKFNDENMYSVGKPNLFSSGDHASKNEKAISLLKQLIKEMAAYKEKEITLSDSFELEFRIVENDNDTDWVEKLTNVGSEGTDVLVKAMINILLLNVFKERAAKKHKDDFRLHCMMDEIGKLHPNNVKGILKFANDRNILLINSSPTSYNATDYRYTYILAKDAKGATSVKRIVSKIAKLKPETMEAQ